MKTICFITAMVLLALPTAAHADLAVSQATGQQLYALIRPVNAAYQFTENTTGLNAGWYTIADAAITGLAAGDYSAEVRVGNAGAPNAADTVLAIIPGFRWTGTAVAGTPTNWHLLAINGSGQVTVSGGTVTIDAGTADTLGTTFAQKVWRAVRTDFADAGSMGEWANWMFDTLSGTGVFKPTAITGGGGGAAMSFIVKVGTFDPNPHVYDIVQGEDKSVVIAVQALGGFQSATPAAITVKFKDARGVTTTVANASITRITQDANFQIFKFTLLGSATATMNPGMLQLEVSIDNQKAQVRDAVRLAKAL